MTVNILFNDEQRYHNQLLKDFNKTVDDVNEHINILQEWAETQAHFPEKPNYKTLRFVILYNKFDLEKAKKKLSMYYTIRDIMPEFFRISPLSPDMEMQYTVWRMVPLPKTTDDGARIIYIRLNPEYTSSKYFNTEKVLCQFLQLIEYLVQEDLSYCFSVISDCAGITFGHGLKTNPFVLKRAANVMENVFSNRLVSFYMVNFYSILDAVINNVIKPLLKPKVRSRMHVHSDTAILLADFGKEKMPSDIGGEEKSIEKLHELLMQKYKEPKIKQRFSELENLTIPKLLETENNKTNKKWRPNVFGSFRIWS